MKHKLALVAASAIGQLSVVAALPFLTRTFSPVEFGPYQTALALAILLQPLATLRIEMALPSASSVDVLRMRTIAHRGIFLASSLLLLLAIFARLREVAFELFLVASLILPAYGLMAVDTSVLIRQQRTTRLIARNLLSGLFVAILQVVAAYTTGEILAVALSVLAGRMLAVICTRIRVDRILHEDESGSAEWTFSRGMTAALETLIANASTQGFRLYGAVFFGAPAAALIGVTQQATSAPLGLISQGLAQAIQSEMAPLARFRSPFLRQSLKRQLTSILPLALAVTLALAFLGPVLAAPIFGPEWAAAGPIIAILGVPAGLQLMTAPVMSVFLMLAMEKRLVILQAVRLALCALGVVAATLWSPLPSLEQIAVGFAIGNSAGYLVMLGALIASVRRFD